MCINAKQLGAMPEEQAAAAAIQMCANCLGIQAASGEAALGSLNTQVEQSMTALALEALPKFVQSKACIPILEKMLEGSDDNMKRADDLLWAEYKVPDDVAGWLHSFVSVAMTYPACIVISDMTIPGNPMCFVNSEFCRVTGYDLREVQGRNCRFLQGPRTEPQSVAVIQDTLRRGADCHVKITNYRKSGELFENLLTMRPVHDSNGVYRYCIGVQFEITPNDPKLKSRLAKLDKLIQLLPKTFEVSSQAVGMTHKRDEPEAEMGNTEARIMAALEGAKSVYSEETLEDGDFYADHYKEHLEHCSKVAQVGHAISHAAPERKPGQQSGGGGKPGLAPKKSTGLGLFASPRVAPKA